MNLGANSVKLFLSGLLASSFLPQQLNLRSKAQAFRAYCRVTLQDPDALPPSRVQDQLPLAEALLAVPSENCPLNVQEAPGTATAPEVEKLADPSAPIDPEPPPGDCTVMAPLVTVIWVWPLASTVIPATVADPE